MIRPLYIISCLKAHISVRVSVFADSVVKFNCEKRNTEQFTGNAIRGREHAHMCSPSWYFICAHLVSLTHPDEGKTKNSVSCLALCAVIIFNQIKLISFFSAGNLVQRTHTVCTLLLSACSEQLAVGNFFRVL